jgi:peptidoglycan hydrolase CwlO-like protein
MINKNNSQDTLSWLKNIVTWAMLGIAGYQFSSLTNKIEEMYTEVITHKEKLNRNDKDVDEIKKDIKDLYEWRQSTKLVENKNNGN